MMSHMDGEQDVLVIGYGNVLRGDDAAGVLAVEKLERSDTTGLRYITTHQLTPELAEDLASACAVLFIDAASDPSQKSAISFPITAEVSQTGCNSHSVEPGELLMLAQALYGTSPRAAMITIPAETFEPRAPISQTTIQGIEQACYLASEFVQDALHSTGAGKGGGNA